MINFVCESVADSSRGRHFVIQDAAAGLGSALGWASGHTWTGLAWSRTSYRFGSEHPGEAFTMRSFLRPSRLAILACLAVGFAASSARAADPPNWKASGAGTTTPVGNISVDEFSGQSTHVGPYVASGFHILNQVDFTFVGAATWKTPNGDRLWVVYSGQIFPSGDPDFPFAFVADLAAVGGTGRLAGACGLAQMTGAFTGVPGDFYFDLEGTIRTKGR
jgi:hypothetical protein